MRIATEINLSVLDTTESRVSEISCEIGKHDYMNNQMVELFCDCSRTKLLTAMS